MALILDTEEAIFIAEDAADMARQLLALLDEHPDDEALTYLAAAALGCDVLDVITTRSSES